MGFCVAMTDPVLFMLALLSLLATPGPTNTLLATSGATVGVRRSLKLLAGEFSGYLLAIVSVRLVLGPVIALDPLIDVVVKVGAAIYLAWVAVRLWRRCGAEAGRIHVTLDEVFFTTMFNPKALVFGLGVIPFGDAQSWAYLVVFGMTVPVMGLGWIVLGKALTASSSGPSTALIPRVASVVLVGFAALLMGSTFG
jgi:threonine/homoserine/homoserine lactone efflux protein